MYDRNKETNTIKNEDYSLLAVRVKKLHNETNNADNIKAETWYTYGNLCHVMTFL